MAAKKTASKVRKRNGSTKKPASKAKKKRRLAAGQRERRIVEEAIKLFAEVGFTGETRELARRLGVTQPLLYRYFPTKEDLIARVYEELYVGRWKDNWGELLRDRGVAMPERLTAFYAAYTNEIFTYEWMRIFFYLGLKGVDVKGRYLETVNERIFKIVCAELRASLGLPPPDVIPITDSELEIAWTLHGSIIYLGIREFIYDMPTARPREEMIRSQVSMFLGGVGNEYARLFSGQAENR